jgi:hypothetical protein
MRPLDYFAALAMTAGSWLVYFWASALVHAVAVHGSDIRSDGCGQNEVARKWRRNALKRLNPRPEMVGPRRRRTHKMWYSGGRLKVRDPG